MTLRERLGEAPLSGAAIVAEGHRGGMAAGPYSELKIALHRQLLDRIDLDAMGRMGAERLREELRMLIDRLITEQGSALNATERRQVIQDIENEVLGYGPLESLLIDPSISDILVNTAGQVYVERRGRLEITAVRFDSNQHLMKIIDKIVARVGRRVDESSPMVDARLPDGSRVNVIIPPLALDGPILSIRKFSIRPLAMHDLVANLSMTPDISELLQGMVKARMNIVISGGTGSGKTTLLNALSAAIPEEERVVTIEDAAELRLQQAHVVRLETRPPNIEGKGEINQRALVRNALRMRPDRIILGEVRGAEAFDMLQAMNTGHEGSMCTVHANTARDGLARLENMIGMSGMTLPPKAMRQQIASAIHAVIQIARMSDGTRKLISLTEITGMEGDMLTSQDIFVFQQQGVDKDGFVAGNFRATGIRPHFVERLKVQGVKLREDLFDPLKVHALARKAAA
jgi:pilus assembly protein CpaF